MSDSGAPPAGPQPPPQGPPWYQTPPPQAPYAQPGATPPGAAPYAGYGQGASQPGWTQPDYGKPGASNRTLVAWVVGVLVAIAGMSIAGLVAFTGGSARAADPASATRTFLTAVQKQDCDALVEVTTLSFRAGRGAAACRESLGDSGGGLSGVLEQATYTIEDTETTGNDAKVTVELSVFGRSTTQVVRLKRSDGEWLVDGFGLEGFSGPSDAPSDDGSFPSVEPTLAS